MKPESQLDRLNLRKSPPTTEFSLSFLQGMLDRMAVSFHKYGAVKDAFPDLDPIGSLQQRLEKYAETGNTEWLMDAANFAMIEFMHPQHPEAHYRGTDSKESPGRVVKGGVSSTTKANLDLDRVPRKEAS